MRAKRGEEEKVLFQDFFFERRGVWALGSQGRKTRRGAWQTWGRGSWQPESMRNDTGIGVGDGDRSEGGICLRTEEERGRRGASGRVAGGEGGEEGGARGGGRTSEEGGRGSRELKL
jgi:hypothetical protein